VPTESVAQNSEAFSRESPYIPAPPAVHRPCTQLQNNIVQQKVFSDGTVWCDRLGLCGVREPQTLNEALGDENWKKAMDEEFSALMKNKAWHLVPGHQANNVIDCKWIYKVKHKSDGTIDHYKVRLVAKGPNQRYGIYYEDNFSPVVKMVTIWIIMSIVESRNWCL
jgi:hypothetical protein